MFTFKTTKSGINYKKRQKGEEDRFKKMQMDELESLQHKIKD